MLLYVNFFLVISPQAQGFYYIGWFVIHVFWCGFYDQIFEVMEFRGFIFLLIFKYILANGNPKHNSGIPIILYYLRS